MNKRLPEVSCFAADAAAAAVGGRRCSGAVVAGGVNTTNCDVTRV